MRGGRQFNGSLLLVSSFATKTLCNYPKRRGGAKKKMKVKESSLNLSRNEKRRLDNMAKQKNVFKKMGKEIGKQLDEVLETAGEKREEAGGTIRENMENIYATLKDEITNSKVLTEKERKKLLKRLAVFCNSKTNIMLVGATGCGKSSTINALFALNEQLQVNNGSEETLEVEAEEEELTQVEVDENGDVIVKANEKPITLVEVAKVGTKADPETKDIEKYTVGNLTLWDTPGLGDGTEIDEHHKAVIQELLEEVDEDGNSLIDLVLVIMDGSTRDLGTSYKILNEVIIPEVGDNTERILVALNQADIAMKTGRHWNYETNEPDETLTNFLKEKVESIKNRIEEDSNIEVDPVYYCAGYVEPDGEEVKPYNLSKLLYYILKSLPAQKRVAVMEGINTDAEAYKDTDEEDDYNEKVKDSFYESYDYISYAMGVGSDLGGELLGIPGRIIGAVAGGILGGLQQVVNAIF